MYDAVTHSGDSTLFMKHTTCKATWYSNSSHRQKTRSGYVSVRIFPEKSKWVQLLFTPFPCRWNLLSTCGSNSRKKDAPLTCACNCSLSWSCNQVIKVFCPCFDLFHIHYSSKLNELLLQSLSVSRLSALITDVQRSNEMPGTSIEHIFKTEYEAQLF